MKKILTIISLIPFAANSQTIIADTAYFVNPLGGYTKVVTYRNVATTAFIPKIDTGIVVASVYSLTTTRDSLFAALAFTTDSLADALATFTQNRINDTANAIRTTVNGKAGGTGTANGTNTGDNATNTQYSGLAASKENSITAGTTAQYWRGDKTFQTLDKAAAGLPNVDNTSNATERAATATLTNKTISGASNTLSAIPQSAVTSLTTDLATKARIVYNQSTASQGAGFATDTYLTGSSIAIPASSLKVGSRYHMVFSVSKTAAGIATPILIIRFGTAGTTSDAARLTFTWTAGTAAIDVATFEVWITVRAVGASAVLQGSAQIRHNLSITGFVNLVSPVIQVTSGSFDSGVANSIIGVSVNGGTSAAWTVTLVQCELSNLN